MSSNPAVLAWKESIEAALREDRLRRRQHPAGSHPTTRELLTEALHVADQRADAADAAIEQLMHFFKPCGWDAHLQRFEPPDCKHPECSAVRHYMTLKG